MGQHDVLPQAHTLQIKKILAFRYKLPNLGKTIVGHNKDPAGNQDVLLPAKSQILQEESAKVEKGSLWKYFSRKKTLGTKTWSPSKDGHSNRIHPGSVAGRETKKKTIGRELNKEEIPWR